MEIGHYCPHCMRSISEGDEICPHCGKNINELKQVTHQLPVGTVLERKYLVGEVLGEGGFGITYIGLDINLQTRVAVKEFYPNGYVSRESATTTIVTAYQTGDDEAEAIRKWQDGFMTEARTLAKFVDEPGVVGARDFFLENQTAYIIMEYVEGQTLGEYVSSRGGRIPVEEMLRLASPVVQSLDAVHREGIVHRDISPDNLMITLSGRMKLLDFGAARDYTSGGEKSLSVMLKHGYAPEEQYRSHGLQGPWTDVYALCATMYRCITGQLPPEAMERMRVDEIKRPSDLGVDISPAAEEALMRGLAVYAEDRTQSMSELYAGLYEEGASATPVRAETKAAEMVPAPPAKRPAAGRPDTLKGDLIGDMADWILPQIQKGLDKIGKGKKIATDTVHSKTAAIKSARENTLCKKSSGHSKPESHENHSS